MTAFVIMHNMILEDERGVSSCDQGLDFRGDNDEHEHPPRTTFQQLVQFHHEMRD